MRSAPLYLWPVENYLHKLRLQRHSRNRVHAFLYGERKFQNPMAKSSTHLTDVLGLLLGLGNEGNQRSLAHAHMCKYTKQAEPLLLLPSWHNKGTPAESFKHKPASCVNNIWLLLVSNCNQQLFTVCIPTAVTDIPEPVLELHQHCKHTVPQKAPRDTKQVKRSTQKKKMHQSCTQF